MTGYLLDTNIILVGITDPDRLSLTVREALTVGPNILSVVSYWEVMLKSMRGKLEVGDPRSWWTLTREQLRASELALKPDHVAAVYGLPPIHRDPFDRILIAQAEVSGLTLLTTDSTMGHYATDRCRILA